jgi:hypothetical protein
MALVQKMIGGDTNKSTWSILTEYCSWDVFRNNAVFNYRTYIYLYSK